MFRTATSTWGITGPQFLWLYGGLCALAGVWAWSRWLGAMRPRTRGRLDRAPDMYDLAMLNGGAQLAITTAAATLHRDGAVRHGEGQMLEAAGELDARAHRLERAVFEAVKQQPAPTVEQLRRELEDGDAVAAMRAELTNAGLLVGEEQVPRLRRVGLAGLVLLALGLVAGSLDDAPLAILVAIVGAVAVVTYRLARVRPIATARGRALVSDRRKADPALRHPSAAESPMAAALFGGGALWSADPAVAQTLGVPREAERDRRRGLYGGYGYGACSAGGTCAGGGILSGGSNGGCGAGGCGGGGGGCGGGS